ncbi:uncharacterized protein ACJ7VT_006206 [Polymixia lowei]
MEACLYAALIMVWCVLVLSEPSCDQTQFLHLNGTCVECPVCAPGEQLSEDCGFGDGGEGLCVVCEEGKFSSMTGVDPCKRCTQCNLLNRLQRAACSATSNALCGKCLPGYYELRSMTGEAELPCVPCYSMATVRKKCFPSKPQAFKAVTAPTESFKQLTVKRTKTRTVSIVLIGSATASSTFLIILIGLSSLSHENEVQPASIVINVTTNIKPSGQNAEDVLVEEQGGGSCCSTEETEHKLQTIWEVAQGQGIEILDYDTVQDLSLLLGSADHRGRMLRRLGRSLGVPPQVLTHLHGFQDLFQYLRTSTYTLLPQLAQAAALLPSPEVVARIHRVVVNK